uniref:Fe2OG dioxygenase domain-containing protein n=1 Tax=Chlamydomonas euryale TaxID=1486919 RepID=A0A7R9VYF6_9CHLO|mmetsp:Transcript_7111/g.21704  ORF Transcript_7111/g.21704 Transcript_7111/m.21704 type:complete len:278 (+) Transcript_7111:353-1186(+)
MRRSTVVGAGGKSVEDSYRTSFGTFLRRCQDEVVERVENRVAAWTHIPLEHQEDIQVLRYEAGQFYKVHADTIRDPQAGVRVATVLVYLNEPSEGGETAFPNSEWVDPELAERNGPFSDCAEGHVAFKPKVGDALLFWSINPDGVTEDPHASHTGCPVLSGVKWTLTKWIHARPFRPEEIPAARAVRARGKPAAGRVEDPSECSDRPGLDCARMRDQGKCESDRDQMIIGAWRLGACRKTCGACRACADGDQECRDENRRNVGYLVFNPSELHIPVQ